MAGGERLEGWLRDQLAAGLPALAGARVAGTIPVQVSLVNDLIAQALADAATTPGPGVTAAPRHTPDVAALVRLVRHVRVDAAPGVVTIDFEIAVGA
jgi:hypothetical protein